MKSAFALPTLLLMAARCLAWNSTIDIVDPSRTSLREPKGRKITVFVCGADGPVKPVPHYIFGHGFDCLGTDYDWLCSNTAVVAALIVSHDISQFVPDTKNLALDQAFLTTALPDAARDASSVLHGRLSGKAILGGHSMGGGTSVLAADSTFTPLATNVAAMVLFAPGLYTTPPAYPSGPKVQAPILLVSGAWDCGPNTLPKEALPLYQNVTSTTKAIVSLKGANHCQWTNAKEGVCSKPECHAISVQDQQEAGRQLLQAFVAALFDGGSWTDFESFLANGNDAKWTYLTMQSAAGSKITNNCPCDSQDTSFYA